MTVTTETIRNALRCGNSGCSCHKGPNVHCPAHDDEHASLTVHDKDGRLLLNCKTGCSQKAVIDALRARSLWTDHIPETPARNGTAYHPVASYIYCDASGTPVAIKGRFEAADIDPATKKALKVFKWRLPDKEAWGLEGMPISEIPLWGAELLAAERMDGQVFLVEGEKAALACRAVGLFAMCHPGGASTGDFGTSLEVLRGRNVVLWPDNDDPGRKFMDRLRTALRSIARSVVTIFPTVPDKGDAVEFFGAGHTLEELLALVPTPPRPVLEFLATEDEEGCYFRRSGLGYAAAFPTNLVDLTIDQLRRSSGELRGEILVETEIPAIPRHLYWGSLILTSGSNREKLAKILSERTTGLGIDWSGIVEVVCRKVGLAERQGEPFTTIGAMRGNAPASNWLVSNFAPRNEPTTIWGDGGIGKSMLVLAMALSIKTGVEIVPGFPPAIKGNVLYLDWEASQARQDIRIKRICAGAGINFVEIGYRRCSGPMADQAEELLRYCQSEGIVLVVVDSVEMAMQGTGGDGSNPNDKVIVLHSALRLLNTSSILIDHINAVGRISTNGAGKPIGGVYKTNLARMAFELRKGLEIAKSGEMHLGLFNMKRNDDGPLMPPVGLRISYGDGWTKYERDGITDVSAPTRERIIAALRKQQPLRNKAIAELIGATQTAVNFELSTNRDGVFVKWPGNVGWGLAGSVPEPSEEAEKIPF